MIGQMSVWGQEMGLAGVSARWRKNDFYSQWLKEQGRYEIELRKPRNLLGYVVSSSSVRIFLRLQFNLRDFCS